MSDAVPPTGGVRNGWELSDGTWSYVGEGHGQHTAVVVNNPPRQRVAKGVIVLAMIALFLGTGFTLGTMVQRENRQKTTGTSIASPTLSSTQRTALLRVGRGEAGSLVDINVQFGGQRATGAGTGMIMDSSGLVVTNNHVIAEATSLSATIVGSKVTYRARVLGYDRSHDVAVLQLVGAQHLLPVHFGGPVGVGADVVGVGNAGGIGGMPLSSPGVVEALVQNIRAGDALTGASENLDGLILASTGIRPGDSGGPLISTDGSVVGMDVAAGKDNSASNNHSVGYSIPASVVERIFRDIVNGQGGRSIHLGATAYLGILTETAKPGVGGVLVASTVPGSPVSGVLRSGDLVTSVGGIATPTSEALTTVVGTMKPGQRVAVVWKINGIFHSATITLASGPAQ